MARPDQYNNATTQLCEDRFRYHPNGPRPPHPNHRDGKVNMGYFVNWGIYARNFQPQDIDVSKLTHILYAFADTDPTTGAAMLTDLYADQEKHYDGDSWVEPGTNLYGAMKQMYLLKQANRGLKTLLSFGGWTYSQAGHLNFVTDPTARATFISTAITLLEDNGFDGIDIDYEYPSSVEQGVGFASLLAELRIALDAHAASKGDTVPYQITAAVSAGYSGYQYLPIAAMDDTLTYWNLMAYDYSGSWSTVSDDHANLFPGKTTTGFSTNASIQYYLGQGASKSKMVMGTPLYGHGFANTDGIRKPFSGVGAGSWEDGIWDYKDLPRPYSTVTEERDSVAAYCYNATTRLLVSYDTPKVVARKAAYVNQNDLAGTMHWELSADKKGADSLVLTSGKTLGKLDKTKNHLSYPGSKFDNIRSQMGTVVTTTTTTSTSTPTPPSSMSTSTAQTSAPPTTESILVAGKALDKE